MGFVKLNEKQHQAVFHNKGAMIVLAGPGSGKTTVIIYRIACLIKKYKTLPKDILVITFTKAAAEEMKKRFNNLFHNANGVMFATFHSFYFRILRSSGKYTLNNILKDDGKREILKNIIKELVLNLEDEEEFLRDIINEISLLKNELIEPSYYSSTCCSAEDFREIFKRYEEYKEKNNIIDFDDMLVKCYWLLKSDKGLLEFWKEKYKYILVDEFQDINKVQYECLKLITGKEENLFIVGDDDQSIYKFRGARPEFLLKFPKDFKTCKRVVLDINYRSTEQIIKLCNAVIVSNKNRYNKIIKGTQKKGNTPILIQPNDIGDEAIQIVKRILKYSEKIKLSDMAIIYRTNIQARAIVEALMDYNIQYQLKDEMPTIYEHWIVKDFLAYLHYALDRKANKAFERIVNKPKRYIGKAVIAEAKKKFGEDVSLLNAIIMLNDLKSWQIVRLDELNLQLNMLSKKNTYDAFKYIRNVIGYDDYIIEYASYRNISTKGLFEIVDELQESTKNYEKIEDYLKHIEDVQFELKEKRKCGNIENTDGVVLSTMHSAKGLEFDIVFVTSVVEGVIPHERSKTLDEIEEERRLFYVAMTRAKKNLFISVIKSRYEKSAVPSMFLKGIVKIGEKNEKNK